MVPGWMIVLTAIELIGFLAFALGIAMAVPEEAVIHARSETSGDTAR
jgi:hypothetical protein